MGRWPGVPLLLVLLVCSLAPARGQDFDLSEALEDDVKPTRKPNPVTKKPGSDTDLNLEDAIFNGGSDDSVKPNPPKPKPKPDHRDSGDFSDDDLKGHTHSGGQDDRHNNEDKAEDSPGLIPGIVSAVVVALAGAVSSFIAYHKKKFCFKGNEDPENINMESQYGVNKEPPVQQILLQK
ncbi:CD99 antigen isoform X1 [Gracilinanus agilis]|uniref:CD99 antigen isoform X1 n=1 Tax=Gracilinanus agilis TaxID=191870 RepID=UPI001CFF3AB0|nr:CD99 antigen isoform X1 [Gracilinanus agilis]